MTSHKQKIHNDLSEKTRFKDSVREWSRRLNVKPAQIRVQRMRNKWASCSSGKRVSFSEDLLRQDAGFQEYVIVHELLHLRIPNHGILFKNLISIYIPNWEELANRSERN
jgi:predicted metal-dependent hydrolase